MPRAFHQLLTSCLLNAVAMVTIANASNSTMLYLVTIPLSLSSMLGKVSYQNYITQTLGKEHTGYLIGIMGSTTSFARLSSPVIVGLIMESFDATLTLYTSSACTLLAGLLHVFIELRTYRSKSKIDQLVIARGVVLTVTNVLRTMGQSRTIPGMSGVHATLMPLLAIGMFDTKMQQFSYNRKLFWTLMYSSFYIYLLKRFIFVQYYSGQKTCRCQLQFVSLFLTNDSQ